MENTVQYVIAVVLGLLGLFYAALPHSIHVNSGIGFGLSHTVHIGIGVVLIVVAIVVFVMARKA